MDVIDPIWHMKLVSIGTDGEHTITGCGSGVQMQFKAEAKYPIVRIWSGLHQIDPVTQWEYEALCDDTFVLTLTALITYLCRQQNLQLYSSLSEMCKVKGPLSAEQLAALNSAIAVIQDNFSVASVDATTFIWDQGTFVIDTLTTIPPESIVAITRSVTNLFVGLYTRIMAVVAARDSQNQSSTDVLPTVLPHSLALICTNELCKLIWPQRLQLKVNGWTTQQIDQIEEDHHKLQRAANSEVWLKELLDWCSDVKTGFMEGWTLCQGCFDKLQLFAGGLASMFPNTATVELDFSIIGAEKMFTVRAWPTFHSRVFYMPSNSKHFAQCPLNSCQYNTNFSVPPIPTIKACFHPTITLIVKIVGFPCWK